MAARRIHAHHAGTPTRFIKINIMQSHQGNIIDIREKKMFYGIVKHENGKIKSIEKIEDNIKDSEPFILPGFVDSHVHVESSLLVPSEFAKLAVVHGTVGTISDPHEIANVCGMAGVRFMIENGKTVPFKFHYGAPSCVPATVFETAGATITVSDVETLLKEDDIYYLSEMMNFPGVLMKDPEVMQKIAAAHKIGKPVDGHAPGLRGEDAQNYIDAGISTDHECFTLEEAADKLARGMKIQIREGSAAKNFEALIPLMHDHSDNMMFCSDDKHPDSLMEGHINQLCARAVAHGVDIWKILKAACINPVEHYHMRIGTLRVNDNADFILIQDLKDFRVLETVIDGETVAKDGKSLIHTKPCTPINQFNCSPIETSQLRIDEKANVPLYAIGALDGQLITEKVPFEPFISNGALVSDVKQDLMKIAVINRYFDAPIATAFIKNTGLKKGAFASSVAHDSHNIVVVGTDDESMAKAVNLIIREKGGLSAVGEDTHILPLPVAGLMSADAGERVGNAYIEIDRFVKEQLGCTLRAPFMTLSFMALLVIPKLKLSDKGLFDGESFRFM